MADDQMQKVTVKGDEFSGFIGNIAGNLIRDRVDLPEMFLAVAVVVSLNMISSGYNNNYDGGGGFFGGGGLPPEPPPEKKSKGKKALNFLGGLIGVKKKEKEKGSTWTP
ncbi:unnamed protein product [Cylicostephanus goldi]|uniref:Uncharacterized protein n=1 Tax=Cylicostephanus goldi TaxID=71465 RepID=A0A3P7MZ27_CYLGO|nr:unnamed protein product [Cylicostephanus goldi]